jgi:hypothetical protein
VLDLSSDRSVFERRPTDSHRFLCHRKGRSSRGRPNQASRSPRRDRRPKPRWAHVKSAV